MEPFWFRWLPRVGRRIYRIWDFFWNWAPAGWDTSDMTRKYWEGD